MVTVIEILAAIGALNVIPLAYRFVSFVWLYFLRPSSVHKYLHGPQPYAFITGGTDGIGRAVAKELYSHGFNLILHGRNEEKMMKVVQEIRASGAQNRDIRYFLADAAKSGIDFEGIMESYKDLNITIALHNVGGTSVRRPRIDGLPESNAMSIMNSNMLFSVLLMRAMLPTLRASAKHGPVVAHFIGSMAGDLSSPRLALYSGSKAFLQAYAKGLDLDERVLEPASGVRVAYLPVGEVVTNAMPRIKDSMYSPSSERFARAYVKRIGYGRRRYAPWWLHGILQAVVSAVGVDILDPIQAVRIRTLVQEQEDADRKAA